MKFFEGELKKISPAWFTGLLVTTYIVHIIFHLLGKVVNCCAAHVIINTFKISRINQGMRQDFANN